LTLHSGNTIMHYAAYLPLVCTFGWKCNCAGKNKDQELDCSLLSIVFLPKRKGSLKIYWNKREASLTALFIFFSTEACAFSDKKIMLISNCDI
jgi:hypothetical protein